MEIGHEYHYPKVERLGLVPEIAVIQERKAPSGVEVTFLTADPPALREILPTVGRRVNNLQVNLQAGQLAQQEILETTLSVKQPNQLADQQADRLGQKRQVTHRHVRQKVVGHLQGHRQVLQVVAVHRLGDHHVN